MASGPPAHGCRRENDVEVIASGVDRMSRRASDAAGGSREAAPRTLLARRDGARDITAGDVPRTPSGPRDANGNANGNGPAFHERMTDPNLLESPQSAHVPRRKPPKWRRTEPPGRRTDWLGFSLSPAGIDVAAVRGQPAAISPPRQICPYLGVRPEHVAGSVMGHTGGPANSGSVRLPAGAHGSIGPRIGADP